VKLFEGRNVIKKVKTHCLKIFYNILKECAELKEKVSTNFRLKIHEKKNIYKIFKSDISKYRNKLLLNLPMRKIVKTFSNININDSTKVKEGKHSLFNFLMNSRWIDLLYFVKRHNKDLMRAYPGNISKFSEITPKDVNEYLEYIKNGSNNYKDRINLDRNYLKLFEQIVNEGFKKQHEAELSNYLLFTNEVNEFIINFEKNFGNSDK
jgi:hypothetical protein